MAMITATASSSRVDKSGAHPQGHWLVAYAGADSHHNIYVGYYVSGSTNLVQTTNGNTTNVSPSITTCGGLLYMAWEGTDGHLNIANSTNGSTFGTTPHGSPTWKVTYSSVPMNVSGPAIACQGSSLLVAYADTNNQARIATLDLSSGNPDHNLSSGHVVTNDKTTDDMALVTDGQDGIVFGNVAFPTDTRVKVIYSNVFTTILSEWNNSFTGNLSGYSPGIGMFNNSPYYVWQDANTGHLAVAVI
jgi:hypothetical protein